jgi:S1-C subfamily serine protease
MKLACAAMMCACVLSACVTAPSDATRVDDGHDKALERARRAVVGVVVNQGLSTESYGSGVVLDTEGNILTVHHVVDGATEALLLLDGGVTLRATVVASDPILDLAVLRAELFIPELMTPATLAEQEPMIGETIWNIGNPFGTSRVGGGSSVGRGVVSALDRTHLNTASGRLYLRCIQHDAPTNPGNSGGGIFNSRGELVGINALITTMRDTSADSGVAFALPTPLIKETARSLLAGETPTHGWLGVERYQQATEIYANGVGRLRAVMSTLRLGGPADVAGVEAGDVLMRVDEQEVYGLHQLLAVENSLEPGEFTKLRINRAGRLIDLQVRVGNRPWPN